MIIRIGEISLWNALSIFTFFLIIFGGTYSTEEGLPIRFYYYYLLILILLPYYFYRFRSINFYILIWAIVLMISGLYSVFKGENTIQRFAKIFFSVTGVYLFSYYLVKYYEGRMEFLFKVYLKISYAVIILAFLMLFSSLLTLVIGFDPLTFILSAGKISNAGVITRASSILMEPSYYALVLGQALFAALCRFIYPGRYDRLISKSEALLVLIGFLISFSSSGIMGLFFAAVLLVLRSFSFKWVIAGMVVMAGFSAFIYSFSYDFRMRFQNSLILLTSQNVDYQKIDLSSFTLYNNAIVTYNNFMNHPLFGTGLGSHPFAYEKYSLTKGIEARALLPEWHTGFSIYVLF